MSTPGFTLKLTDNVAPGPLSPEVRIRTLTRVRCRLTQTHRLAKFSTPCHVVGQAIVDSTTGSVELNTFLGQWASPFVC